MRLISETKSNNKLPSNYTLAPQWNGLLYSYHPYAARTEFVRHDMASGRRKGRDGLSRTMHWQQGKSNINDDD